MALESIQVYSAGRRCAQARCCGCAQSILTGESGSVAKFVGAVSTRKAVYQDKTCLLFSVRPQSPVMRATGVG